MTPDPLAQQGASRVLIVAEDRGGPGWSVYDAQEWFAHSSTITGALKYASDLLHGPGVGPRGSVWNLMRTIEETDAPTVSPDSPFGV